MYKALSTRVIDGAREVDEVETDIKEQMVTVEASAKMAVQGGG